MIHGKLVFSRCSNVLKLDSIHVATGSKYARGNLYDTVDGIHPAQLGMYKEPCKKWEKLHIN